jgi:SDR family mycofactocin-dependent oxidoreductase
MQSEKEDKMGQLDGQVAIVTGAGRGQGRAHALALAAEGASVVVCDIAAQIDTVPFPLATKDELDETVALVEKTNVQCLGIVADIRDTDQVNSVVEQTLAAFGRIDILIANAAICTASPFEEITDQMWSDMIDTNLTGTFKCLRAVLPAMRSQRYGRIVVVSSMTGRHGNPNLAHYSSSKFAVIGLAKTLALEVAEEGITVNVMCPTSVNTPMLHNAMNYALFCPDIEHPTIDDVRPRFASLNPMRIPWIEPEIFSRAVMYLVTDPGFLTGTVHEVSAGISAQNP